MQPFTFFVSYRRQDTGPIALLLKHEIEKRLRFVRVSVDVESIEVGQEFPGRLRDLISGAHATIVLIGRQWMPGPGAADRATQEDWVVQELAHSISAPLAMPKIHAYGLEKREILPIFANCEKSFADFSVPTEIKFVTKLHAEQIFYAEWPSAIGPLLDRIAVRLNLKRRPDKDEYPQPDIAKARTQPLGDLELLATLAYDDYDGWYLDNHGDAEARYLVKTFEFRGFNEASDFMREVSDYCKVLNHHPEWRNVFNHVTVSLTTWDARRKVTIYDLNLALYMNKVAEAVRDRH